MLAKHILEMMYLHCDNWIQVEDNLDISEAKMNQVIEEIIDRERETIWTVTQMDDEESCSNLRERVIVQRVAEPCPDFQSKGDRGQISKYYY